MNLSELFRKYYVVVLTSEKDQIKYWLIEKFKYKVSKKLLDEQNQIYKMGLEQFAILCIKPNPFLKFIPKNEPGSNFHIPVIIGEK